MLIALLQLNCTRAACIRTLEATPHDTNEGEVTARIWITDDLYQLLSTLYLLSLSTCGVLFHQLCYLPIFAPSCVTTYSVPLVRLLLSLTSILIQGAHSSSGGGDLRGILRLFGIRISPSSGESTIQKYNCTHALILSDTNAVIICYL